MTSDARANWPIEEKESLIRLNEKDPSEIVRFDVIGRASASRVLIISPSRKRAGEHALWQRRFYEHTCRDEADLKRCLDYVHVNPLRHGLVKYVADWPWSSFHRYRRLGEYDANWGGAAVWHGDEFRDFE